MQRLTAAACLLKTAWPTKLTMREVGEDGFGAKVRDWNRTELPQSWRERWADHVNNRLASLTSRRAWTTAASTRAASGWRQLDTRRLAAYQAGDIGGGRSLRNSMGEMARSLERDPQLESILAIKKSAQLGIEGLAREHSLTRQFAMSIGFDLRRGRGLGL